MYIFCQRRKNGKKKGKKQLFTITFYRYMYMFLLPKCKVNAESYSNHATSAQTQQSDIQVLHQRFEQFSVTPIQLG